MPQRSDHGDMIWQGPKSPGSSAEVGSTSYCIASLTNHFRDEVLFGLIFSFHAAIALIATVDTLFLHPIASS
jgi:hypothetical protein